MAQLATPSLSSIVLLGFDPATTRTRCDGDTQNTRDHQGNRCSLDRYRTLPAEWANYPDLHHPAYWHIYLRLVDTAGRKWDRNSTAVTNDFGDLVEVATC
jgi:hypothetical protein